MSEREEPFRAVPCTLRGSFFGEVSLKMLLGRLGAYNVLYTPSGNKTYSWFVAAVAEDNLDYLLKGEISERTLFLCRSDICQMLLKREASCSCIMLVEEGENYAWVFDPLYNRRVIVIEQPQHFYVIETIVQRLFSEVLMWESRLDYYVLRGKRKPQFDMLLSISQEILGNFVCIMDNGFNFVAYSTDEKYTQGAAPYAGFLAQKCFDVDEIDFITQKVLPLAKPTAQLVICAPDERHPHTTFHYPVYINGEFVYHVVMVCEFGSVDYLRDVFTKFIGRIAALCRDFWKISIETSAPWQRLFNALIDRTPLEKTYRETQMRASFLPRITQMRLLVYRFEESMPYDYCAGVVEAARHLNGGQSLPFMRDRELIVICYALDNDEARLSAANFTASFGEHVNHMYGITAGSSQRIDSLDDLSYGYQQAVTALAYRERFDAERRLYGRYGNASYVPFDLILKYYLLEPDYDQELVRYSFEHNIFRLLVEEDARKGTSVADMVVSFVGNNLNGTQTAQALHAHRNTVLYHVARVEKRFGISLKDPFTSQRLMLDYHYYLARS